LSRTAARRLSDRDGIPASLSPGSIAGLEIRNRIVQSPMGTGLVEMGRVTEREAASPKSARAPASD
jgi:2,4-dienoyl-CoA reductase-like NADH-dependent reductase (Old Yellow Enzyme family)